jgi:hypothetical protein
VAACAAVAQELSNDTPNCTPPLRIKSQNLSHNLPELKKNHLIRKIAKNHKVSKNPEKNQFLGNLSYLAWRHVKHLLEGDDGFRQNRLFVATGFWQNH